MKICFVGHSWAQPRRSADLFCVCLPIPSFLSSLPRWIFIFKCQRFSSALKPHWCIGLDLAVIFCSSTDVDRCCLCIRKGSYHKEPAFRSWRLKYIFGKTNKTNQPTFPKVQQALTSDRWCLLKATSQRAAIQSCFLKQTVVDLAFSGLLGDVQHLFAQLQPLCGQELNKDTICWVQEAPFPNLAQAF